MAFHVLYPFVLKKQWEAYMKTGTIVDDNWLYVSECCLMEVYFESGGLFSRCPRCSGLCGWEMVDVSDEDLKGYIDTSRITKSWGKWADAKILEPRHSC